MICNQGWKIDFFENNFKKIFKVKRMFPVLSFYKKTTDLNHPTLSLITYN
jgi:hypothetical protein